MTTNSAYPPPDDMWASTPAAPSRRRRLTRRGFLIASGVVGAAGVGGGAAWAALSDSAGSRSTAAAASSTSAGTLVLVTLYGGNDGLDTVIPIADPAYRDTRGDLAIAEHDALPLSDGLAFHPSLQRLKRRFDEKTVAVVRGVGYPEPDHSHFRSMAIWQTAAPQAAVRTGWLGRWLDLGARTASAGRADTAIQAVGIGATVTPALVGEHRSAAAVPLGGVEVPAGPLGAGIRTMYAGADPADPPLLRAAASVDTDYVAVDDRLAPILGGASTGAGNAKGAKSGGKSGGGDLRGQLDIVARLINAGVPTQAYAVSLGGFDTHAGEHPTHATLLGEVDSALDGFLTSVERSPHAQRLVVMVYSEFGRRVAPNASGGTDHGTASPVILLGPGVRGGMYGDQPSLTKLGSGPDEGDLVATTDFRDVYATVLSDVLATEPKDVLGPGRQPLGFVRT